MWDIDMDSPEMQEAIRVAEERLTRAQSRRCTHGNCMEYVDQDGEVFAGFGPAGCPCQSEEED